jgi:hypothetical protein
MSKFKCSEENCGYINDQKHNVETHMLKKHPNKKLEVLILSTKIICEFCNKQYLTVPYLKIHVEKCKQREIVQGNKTMEEKDILIKKLQIQLEEKDNLIKELMNKIEPLAKINKTEKTILSNYDNPFIYNDYDDVLSEIINEFPNKPQLVFQKFLKHVYSLNVNRSVKHINKNIPTVELFTNKEWHSFSSNDAYELINSLFFNKIYLPILNFNFEKHSGFQKDQRKKLSKYYDNNVEDSEFKKKNIQEIKAIFYNISKNTTIRNDVSYEFDENSLFYDNLTNITNNPKISFSEGFDKKISSLKGVNVDKIKYKKGTEQDKDSSDDENEYDLESDLSDDDFGDEGEQRLTIAGEKNEYGEIMNHSGYNKEIKKLRKEQRIREERGE